MLAATNSAPLSRPSPALQWRHLQFPAQAGHLNSCAAQDTNQNTALQTLQDFLCEDARCAENGQTDVYVGSRDGTSQSIVPWHAQTVSLPIRLGEKVLWAPQLQAIRLTPLAQQGVLAADDGIALLQWLRQTQPDRSVVLTDVATDTPLYASALRAAVAGFVLTKNSPDAHLFHRFTGTYLDFFNSRSSKYKNQLRKKEKVSASEPVK